MTSAGIEPVRLAVIGPGWSGRRLLRVAQSVPTVSATHVVGRRTGRLVPPIDGAPVDVQGDLGAVLSDRDVDAVAICTPPRFQVPLAMEAVKHGKHVLVEKPVGLIPADLAVLRSHAEARGLTIAVAYHLACNPAVESMASAIQRGSYGTIIHASFRMYVSSDRPTGRWLRRLDEGGHPFIEILTHGYHLMTYLLGGIAEITGVVPFVHGDRVAGGVVHVVHENGCSSVLECSSLGTPANHSGFVEVTGTEGSVLLDRGHHGNRRYALRSMSDGKLTHHLEGDDDIGFKQLLRDFSGSVRGHARTRLQSVGLKSAANALSLALESVTRVDRGRGSPHPDAGGAMSTVDL